MVDEPKADEKNEQPTPVANPNPEQHAEQSTSQHKRAKNIVVALKTGLKHGADWLQERNGAITALATVVIAAATIFYVLYSGAQWREMNSLNKKTKEAVTEARRAANAAIAANEAAGRNFARDQRPYIWLSQLDQPGFLIAGRAPLGQIGWSYRYVNYGRSPAHNIVLLHEIVIGDLSTARPGDLKTNLSQMGVPLPPTKVDYSTAVDKNVIAREEFERIFSRDGGITVFGKFTYADASGGQYETGFCFYHLRTGAVSYCNEGNYIK